MARDRSAVAVLMKLRAGVTKGEVRELVALLERIGDPTWLAFWKEHGAAAYRNDPALPGVYKYDDFDGDPAFYIP